MGEAKRRKRAGDYPASTVKPARAQKPAMPLEPITWDMVQPADRHPQGEAVVQLLQELRAEHGDLGGKLMVVLLEDGDGQPVIRIQTLGLSAFMGVVGGLQDLDLRDRLEERAGPERGIDAAFS